MIGRVQQTEQAGTLNVGKSQFSARNRWLHRKKVCKKRKKKKTLSEVIGIAHAEQKKRGTQLRPVAEFF